jgi:hypothetical protein
MGATLVLDASAENFEWRLAKMAEIRSIEAGKIIETFWGKILTRKPTEQYIRSHKGTGDLKSIAIKTKRRKTMYRLMDNQGNAIREFSAGVIRERNKPARKTAEYAEAFDLWKSDDECAYHFEDESGTILDPFTLTPELV